ncbi:hypothetical protein BH23DEI1_BH23DEI1_12860 [soil metagenome]|nr:hypothetical protein [Trueperaceae bacterium]
MPASIAILAGIAAPAATLALGALLGSMTRLVAMPDWLGMNIVAAVLTGTVTWLGIELAVAERYRVTAG